MKQPIKSRVRLEAIKFIYSRGSEAGGPGRDIQEWDWQRGTQWNATQNFVGVFVTIFFRRESLEIVKFSKGSVTLKIWSNAYQTIIMGRLKGSHYFVSLNVLGKRSHFNYHPRSTDRKFFLKSTLILGTSSPCRPLVNSVEIANSCSPTPTPKKEQDISHISQAALNVLSLAKKKKKKRNTFLASKPFPTVCISAEMLPIWFW